MSSAQGQELWHFPDFLSSVYYARAATSNDSKAGSKAASSQVGDLLFKDAQINNCRLYINAKTDIFVPMHLYEEKKNEPMQIFESLTYEYLSDLMSRQQGLNFVTDPIDLVGNFGDANSRRLFVNTIVGKVNLNVSAPVLETYLTFRAYLENVSISRRLKQYRP